MNDIGVMMHFRSRDVEPGNRDELTATSGPGGCVNRSSQIIRSFRAGLAYNGRHGSSQTSSSAARSR